MKIIKKLKALFFKDDQPITMDLAAAEIKEGKAFLHPKDDPNIIYRVKSDDIEVRLSKGKSLTDNDIIVIQKRKEKTPEKAVPKDKERTKKPEEQRTPHKQDGDQGNIVYDLSRFKKKTFSVSLYPEEYDSLMEMIDKYGYKRSEFILASAHTATQGTMARAQKRVVMVRKGLRMEEKEIRAKQKHNR